MLPRPGLSRNWRLTPCRDVARAVKADTDKIPSLQMDVLSVKDSVGKLQIAESGEDQRDGSCCEFIVTESQHNLQISKERRFLHGSLRIRAASISRVNFDNGNRALEAGFLKIHLFRNG